MHGQRLAAMVIRLRQQFARWASVVNHSQRRQQIQPFKQFVFATERPTGNILHFHTQLTIIFLVRRVVQLLFDFHGVASTIKP